MQESIESCSSCCLCEVVTDERAELEPTDGNAFIHGKSIVDDKNEVKRMIAVSPQETAVAAGLTVNENLKLICGVHGFSKLRAEERTELLLDRLGLCEVKDKKADKLSGGWQRRLSLAMALISEPRVLFLDKPTLGLDVIARSELWDIVRALKGSITIVLTTHYMEEAEALSDRIGIMKRGRLIACTTADEIKQRTGQSRFEDAFILLRFAPRISFLHTRFPCFPSRWLSVLYAMQSDLLWDLN